MGGSLCHDYALSGRTAHHGVSRQYVVHAQSASRPNRPVILTQHGRGAAVVMDVGVYEDMLDEIEILRDIRIAEEQMARGEGIPHEEVVTRLRARLIK